MSPAAFPRVVRSSLSLSLIALLCSQSSADVNLTNSPGFRAECSISTSTSNPNKMVAVGHPRNSAPQEINTFYTTDGGNSWTFVELNDPISAFPVSDPSVAFAPTGDTVYVAYLAITPQTRYLICARSLDGGQTYAYTTVADSGILDKPFVATGLKTNGNGHNVYISYYGPGGVVLSRSTNDGISFDPPTLIDSNPNGEGFSVPAGGLAGEVFVVYTGDGLLGTDATIRVRRSTNEGVSFSGSVIVANTWIIDLGVAGLTSIPAQRLRGIGAVPSIAVDRGTGPGHHPGRVYVSYVTTTAPNAADSDTDIAFQYSDNGGSAGSWSAPVIVHKSNVNSQFHPWLSVDPISGAVGIIFYDARKDTDSSQRGGRSLGVRQHGRRSELV
jgi:hypothetical protein